MPNPFKIGIVGAGAAGLRTAMQLINKGHQVHIFEATGRVGGRIYTHRFNTQKNQYFEAGAMRVPVDAFQRPFFDLVTEVNGRVPPEDKVKLIPYYLERPKNFAYVNRVRNVIGEAEISSASDVRPVDVNWPPIQVSGSQDWNHLSVRELLRRALAPLLATLQPEQPGFHDRFWQLVESVDHMSFRTYLLRTMNWPSSLVDFVETIASQTNQYSLSTVELVMQNLDFNTAGWKTIADGMDRLPQAMQKIIGLDKITFNAPVDSIHDLDNGLVRIRASGIRTIEADFDKVVVAIPSAALRVFQERPAWPTDKEVAIRAMHSEPLYKMGLWFKTRFWEGRGHGEKGGQSVTDLPIRWIVLPSYGIGDDGSGALLVYAWMTDAQYWLPLSKKGRRALAIKNLSKAYPDVDVEGQLMDAFDYTWATSSATGDALFYPGQWGTHFKPACRPEGNVHFAGEHLSFSHTWISGALESADRVVDEIGPPLHRRLPASLRYIYREIGGDRGHGVPLEYRIEPGQDIPGLTRDLGEKAGPVRYGPIVAHLSGTENETFVTRAGGAVTLIIVTHLTVFLIFLVWCIL